MRNYKGLRRSSTVSANVCFVGLLAAVATAANAATVQLATYSEIADTTGAVIGAPAGGRLEINNASTGTTLFNPQCDPVLTTVCGTSYARADGIPEAAVSGAISGAEFASTSSATVNYYFDVASPNNVQTTVPLLFTGSLSTTASGAWAHTQAYFSTNAGIPFQSQVTNQNVTLGLGFVSVCAGAGSDNVGGCATVGGGNGINFTNLPFSVGTGNQFSLSVSANGTANPSNGTPGSYSALADPTISIDPTWLISHPGYSVEFSSNIAPVPVPASFWLLLSALGGLGLMMRTRPNVVQSLRARLK